MKVVVLVDIVLIDFISLFHKFIHCLYVIHHFIYFVFQPLERFGNEMKKSRCRRNKQSVTIYTNHGFLKESFMNRQELSTYFR